MPPASPTVEFVRLLAAISPGAREVLGDHVRANGEILPHVFLGELMPWLAGAVAGEAASEARAIVDALERGFSSGPAPVDELVAVSFLENLPLPTEPGAAVRDLLGPVSRAHVERYGL